MSFIAKFFMKKYMKEAYKPKKLPKLPTISRKECFIEKTPWISYKVSYCFASALQMACHYYGEKWIDLGYVNFTLGWTYTWVYIKNIILGGGDPLEAMPFAAPYLGLSIHYYTTNSEEAFLNAIKYFISERKPVLIELNPEIVYRGKESETREPLGFSAHAELFIGYSGENFYFYETAGEDKYLEEGGEGIEVKAEDLARAVESVTKQMMMSWKYHLHVLEKCGEGVLRDYKPIYKRLSELLIGSVYGGWVYLGAKALREVASKREMLGSNVVKFWLRHAVDSRRRNSVFLREFIEEEQGEVLSELMEEASSLYSTALKKIDERDLEGASRILFKIAELEERAGKIFRELAK
ncbi:MAG: hypothetical protein DRJ63_08155 [Thermoprotei archaeon]|nr:MAG: hypothetical protein DRJ63_08155 [Thermoprotei archaeon]